MTAFVLAAVILLVAAIIVGVINLVLAKDGPSRAVVGDLLYFSAIGVLVMIGTLAGSGAVFIAAMIAALLGIVATIALARIITRGRR